MKGFKATVEKVYPSAYASALWVGEKGRQGVSRVVRAAPDVIRPRGSKPAEKHDSAPEPDKSDPHQPSK